MDRRIVLGALASMPMLAACRTDRPRPDPSGAEARMSELIRAAEPLGLPCKTQDPFVFCVHHDDADPAGNEQMGPAVSLAGRDIGQDFGGADGWSLPRSTGRGWTSL